MIKTWGVTSGCKKRDYSPVVDGKPSKSIWVILAGALVAIWIAFGLVSAYNDRIDCSVPSNMEEPLCQPEEPDSYTGFDPNSPGEPYDGGDFPAP